jgi:hypothetical protein
MNAKLTNMQTEATKELNIQTKISTIKLDNFHLEKSIKDSTKLNLENFQYEFNVNMGVNMPKNEIRVNLNVNIYSDVSKKIKVGNIDSHGVFIVQKLAEVIQQSEGKIPNVILANFIGVLISTTRGFLIDKSQKTSIEGAIIPIVNPAIFFPKK